VVTAVEFFFPAYNYSPTFDVRLDLIKKFHAHALDLKMDLSKIVFMVEGYCQELTNS
jgi:hypothetical protein